MQVSNTLISISLGAVSGGLSVATQCLFGTCDFVHGIVLFSGVGIPSALITSGLIRWYTKKSIAPIYKSIYSQKLSEPELKKKFHHQQVLARVNEDVEAWAKNKTTEIEHLKELELYRKEFLGNVAHELKTPLFNIQGYVLTLLDGALEDPAINRRYLERTQKNVNRLINTVNDLDMITKLESRENLPVPETFDLVELVQEVFSYVENLARKRGINLLLTQAYDPIYVNADRKQISQVLLNLISNGIAYGKEKGKVSLRFSHTPNHILVEVSDNGIGIEHSQIPRIFERFYRVDKHRSREDGGTGLGLAIVKHILEAHGQNINVISAPGYGSTFAFTLDKAE